MSKFVCIVMVAVMLITAAVDVMAATEAVPDAPKSIILMVGDGMGINQLRSAELYADEVMDADMIINTIEDRGTTTTYSADTEVTDSAAAMTAMVSGHKINNGAINVLPDGRYITPLTFPAREAGKAIGVVSTTRLTHATPAACFAQIDNRDEENAIAEQMAEFAPEVAMGGGARHFIPQSEDGSKREDDRDLVQEMKDAGYAYVTNADELMAVDPESTDKLLGFFAGSHMAYEVDRLNTEKYMAEPSIAQMTEMAIKTLEQDPDGFFLMVEGGRIDHACHAHDAKASIMDTIAFDEAVKVALDYAAEHPEVLVIVTADHETGGMGLGIGTGYFTDITKLSPINASMEDLNQRIMAEPEKAADIASAAGLELDDTAVAMLTAMDPDAKLDEIEDLATQGTGLEYYPDISDYIFSWAHFVLSNATSNQARIGWTSYAHTAQPIVTYAVGPKAEEFTGFFDNTDLAKSMAAVLGLDLPEPVAAS